MGSLMLSQGEQFDADGIRRMSGGRSTSPKLELGQEVSVKFLIPILLAVICT